LFSIFIYLLHGRSYGVKQLQWLNAFELYDLTAVLQYAGRVTKAIIFNGSPAYVQFHGAPLNCCVVSLYKLSQIHDIRF